MPEPRPDSRPLAVTKRWDARLYSERSFTSTRDLLRPNIFDSEPGALFDAMVPPGKRLKEHMQKARSTDALLELTKPAKVPHIFTRVERSAKSADDAVSSTSLLSGGALHYSAPVHHAAVVNPSAPRPRSATFRSARSFATTPSTAGPGTYTEAYHLQRDHLRLRRAAFKRHLLDKQRAIGEYDQTLPTGKFGKGADGKSGEAKSGPALMAAMLKRRNDAAAAAQEADPGLLRPLPMPQRPLAPYHRGVAFGNPETSQTKPARAEIASTTTGEWIAPGKYNAEIADPLVRKRSPSAIVPSAEGNPPPASQLAPNSYDLSTRPVDTSPAGASHVYLAHPFAKRPFASAWRSSEQRVTDAKQRQARIAQAVALVSEGGQQRQKEEAVERFRRRDIRSADAAKRRQALEQAKAAQAAAKLGITSGIDPSSDPTSTSSKMPLPSSLPQPAHEPALLGEPAPAAAATRASASKQATVPATRAADDGRGADAAARAERGEARALTNNDRRLT